MIGIQTEKELDMETVLIDTFLVPAAARSVFLTRARQMQSFIKTLPGFVEGFLYEPHNAESQHQFLTIAVWESAAAFENAKQAVAVENQRQGVNPQALNRQLGVEFIRILYDRSPY